jgi:hypothetical protein
MAKFQLVRAAIKEAEVMRDSKIDGQRVADHGEVTDQKPAMTRKRLDYLLRCKPRSYELRFEDMLELASYINDSLLPMVRDLRNVLLSVTHQHSNGEWYVKLSVPAKDLDDAGIAAEQARSILAALEEK